MSNKDGETRREPTQKELAAQERAERLRQQLRANLQRRKAQARSRGTSKQTDQGQ